jgi:hypothetical protein
MSSRDTRGLDLQPCVVIVAKTNLSIKMCMCVTLQRTWSGMCATLHGIWSGGNVRRRTVCGYNKMCLWREDRGDQREDDLVLIVLERV